LLLSDHQRKFAARCTAGRVDRSVDHRLLNLERRIAAERGVAVDHRPVVEQAQSGAEYRLRIDRVGEAEARLEHVLVRLRQAGRQPVPQPIELAAPPPLPGTTMPFNGSPPPATKPLD